MANPLKAECLKEAPVDVVRKIQYEAFIAQAALELERLHALITQVIFMASTYEYGSEEQARYIQDRLESAGEYMKILRWSAIYEAEHAK